MPLQFLNPEGLSQPRNYSQVVIATGSRLVFVAGQVATDAAGNLVGGDDLEMQAMQAYRNVATALAAGGATLPDVAKLTTFVVDHGPGKLTTAMAARAAVFGPHAPAATFLGVQALASPEYLIEVEALAVIDS